MELLNYIGFWKQYASDVSACMAWDWFAISTLEACQTDRLESKMLLSVCIYQHQNWLTCSLRGIQSAWLNRVLQNEAPSGTVLLHLVHGICVLSVWVCLRVCWNQHLTQLCIHMWSVFLSQVPDTLFLCTTYCANKTANAAATMPVSLIHSSSAPLKLDLQKMHENMGSHYLINYKCATA